MTPEWSCPEPFFKRKSRKLLQFVVATAIGAGSGHYDDTYACTLTIGTFAKVNYMTRRLGGGMGEKRGETNWYI